MTSNPCDARAVADLGWSQPTLIQEKAIPLALEGKTPGSSPDRIWEDGCLCCTCQPAHPDLQTRPVSRTCERSSWFQPRAGSAGPDHDEAADGVLLQGRPVADISGKADLSAQRPILMEKPDVVVGTPSRVLAHLNAQNLVLHSSLETLVVDEADLLFSFSFAKIYQSFLMSATLTEDARP
ncbi:hypothetical protein INR49_007304 [Caranx melampygus]|nr:hypothetical protein INR49_007304 [Caranx melampygus]